jgi:hypothetical protein
MSLSLFPSDSLVRRINAPMNDAAIENEFAGVA